MKRTNGMTYSGEMSAITELCNLGTLIAISISFNPILPNEDILQRPDVIWTYGRFFLKYGPHEGMSRSMRKNYDMVYYFLVDDYITTRRFTGPNPIYVSYNDFLERGGKYPFQRFVIRCSSLNERTFQMARENPNVPIPFILDLDKYNRIVGQDNHFTTDQLILMRAVGQEMKKQMAVAAREHRPFNGNDMAEVKVPSRKEGA